MCEHEGPLSRPAKRALASSMSVIAWLRQLNDPVKCSRTKFCPISDMRESRSTVVRSIAIYVGLWIPAVLVSALVTLAGLMAFLSAPISSALSFLLALPAVLLGIKSFRTSAMLMATLLVWDIVTTTWPHINLNGFFQSLIDVLLLVSTGMVVLVATFSPFTSVLGFVRQTWPR
jgi:hypothetical protein